MLEAQLRAAPLPDSDDYVIPTGAERGAVADAARLLLEGRADAAAESARLAGFAVEELNGSGGELLSLREEDPASRGWGIVVVDPDAPVEAAVEVPHPIADARTELLGAQIFEELDARVLVMAGANRFADRAGASDVAHRRDSIFHAVHLALIAARFDVIQLHGFDPSRHPGYPDAVVSNGTRRPEGLASEVAAALGGTGIPTCLFPRDGCADLAGTTNVQALASSAAGTPFVHVELSRAVRDGPDDRARLVGAIADAMRRWVREGT